MKRIKLLFAFLLCSTVFLLVQIFFFKNVSKQGYSALQMLVGGHPAAWNLSIIGYENMADLSGIFFSAGVLVFVIDTHILSSITRNETSTESCRFLCSGRNLTSVGVVDQNFNRQSTIFASIRNAGFNVLHFEDSDPRLSGVNSVSKILAHTLLEKKSHYIHIVHFYQRPGNYLWHGQLLWDTVSPEIAQLQVFVPIKNLLIFGENSGAFDKMEIITINIDNVKIGSPKFPTVFLEQIPHSRFIECNHTRAKEFYKIYGKDNSPESVEFFLAAKKLLTKAKKVLDELNIRFWMSSGTCLGWFRQCDIIPYSKDVDLGIWIQDYDIRLIPAFQLHGMPIIHLFGKESDSFELSFKDGDIKLDIFFFYTEGDIMWNGGTQARTGNKYKYIFPKFTLCWTEFLEMKIRIPCETRSYIEANYGIDWFIPVKHWDWKKSPPNVHKNGKWPENERETVIRLSQ